MPLSDEQRRAMSIHIRSNTIYDWHVFGTESIGGLSHIVKSIEQALDATGSFTCDLFLPNCFINGCENSRFWFKMAAIASSYKANSWHEMEYGAPLSREDLRQRYVYTWTYRGDTYRFYTKQLNDGGYPELVWYIGVYKNDIDSSDDTDSEEIALQSL